MEVGQRMMSAGGRREEGKKGIDEWEREPTK